MAMLSLISIIAAAVSAMPAGAPTPEPTNTAAAAEVRVETIATGLQVPWGIDFLPNGDALVAERTTGKIKRIPRGGGRAADGQDASGRRYGRR